VAVAAPVESLALFFSGGEQAAVATIVVAASNAVAVRKRVRTFLPPSRRPRV
jgi:hypothetical protein